MKRVYGWLILGGVSLLIIVAVVLVRESEPTPSSKKPVSGETSIEAKDSATAVSAETGSREPASVLPLNGKDEAKVKGSVFKTFAYSKELKDYMQLKAKVFMTDTEKERRSNLLADVNFLRGAGELLRASATIESEDFDQQSRAMDLLLEALSSPSKNVAAEALRDVVKDSQIENEKLDTETRRSLAGVKAEVMYQWAARDPESARDIPSWLPGPVSQKIWRNVIEAQEQNLLESAQEVPK